MIKETKQFVLVKCNLMIKIFVNLLHIARNNETLRSFHVHGISLQHL